MSLLSTKPAVILHPSGAVVTFAELDASANRLGHFLRHVGLARGDTVAIVMDNNEHIHAAMWAARRSGLYYTMVNTHLSAAEVAYIVHDSGAKAVISSQAMRDVCEQLAGDLPDGLPSVALIAGDDLAGWQRYPDCAAAMPSTPIHDECDGQLLQYSAGSTGRPKGIRRPLNPGGGRSTLSTPVFEALGVGRDSVYIARHPRITRHRPCGRWLRRLRARRRS